MIELKLTEEQINTIKTCVLSTAKQPNIDEGGMFMLMGLTQEINRQVEAQVKLDEIQKPAEVDVPT